MATISKTKSVKLKPLDAHLPKVLKLIGSDECPDKVGALLSLLNLGRHPVQLHKDGIEFEAGSHASHVLKMSAASAAFVMAKLVGQYSVSDPSVVQAALMHRCVHEGSTTAKQKNGQYYTPSHVMDAIEQLMAPILKKRTDAVLFDPASGTGALLSRFHQHHRIAADLDPVAIAVLNEMGFAQTVVCNSLHGASRGKFGIGASDSLIVITNPPFNGKGKDLPPCDPAYAASDSSVSFIKMAAALKPDSIVAVLPLSTLSKERNFKSFGFDDLKYRYAQGFIMSSKEFALGGAEFAILVAVFEPGLMSYADIEQAAFPIFENKGGILVDSGKRLLLDQIETTQGFIRSMTPKAGSQTTSSLGIYQFNFRDINFVKGHGNLSDTESASSIPVEMDTLGKYAYINCFKRYFANDFVVGNLTPLCRKTDFANPDFVDACIYDAIIANAHRMVPFSRTNKKSLVITHKILDSALIKAMAFTGLAINPHQAFVDFWTHGTGADALAPFFRDYFAALKAENLRHTATAMTSIPTIAAAVV